MPCKLSVATARRLWQPPEKRNAVLGKADAETRREITGPRRISGPILYPAEDQLRIVVGTASPCRGFA